MESTDAETRRNARERRERDDLFRDLLRMARRNLVCATIELQHQRTRASSRERTVHEQRGDWNQPQSATIHRETGERTVKSRILGEVLNGQDLVRGVRDGRVETEIERLLRMDFQLLQCPACMGTRCSTPQE
jgi:hypothetical protein